MTVHQTTRRLLPILTILGLLVPGPVHAQVVVFDPGVLAQLIRILGQMQQQYDRVVAQRRIWQQLARPLPAGRPTHYVVPATPWSMSRGTNDLDPFGVYPPLRSAIEHGDPTGRQWRQAVIPLQTYPPSVVARLSSAQHLRITREYTHPLTSDGLGMMGVHALAYNRQGHQAASRALDRLSNRLRASDRGNIALHQQLAGTEILAAREENLRNVYLAYLVEDLVADLKRLRDAYARRLQADLLRRQAGQTVTAQTTARMDNVLREFWRRSP